MNRETLKTMLRNEEAVRKYPYDDATGKAPVVKGKLSIGVGRNLTDKGLRSSEINFMLDNDVDEVLGEIARELPWFDELSEARQLVVADMVFNLGMPKFLEFKATISAIKNKRFGVAADQMMQSKWYRQVGGKPGQRGATLVAMMRAG